MLRLQTLLFLWLTVFAEGWLPVAFQAGRARSLVASLQQSTTTRHDEGSTKTMTNENDDEDPIVDQSTLTLLEHININVPTQQYILPFYFKLLGCGMDPRKTDNLFAGAVKQTLWANCGASQFHLPYGDVAQCIPGKIGLSFDSLQGVKERLARAGDCVQSSQEGFDSAGRPYLQLVDVYSNVFYCRELGNPVADASWKQPFITPSETEQWGEFATEYGRESATDCRGIDFVEFKCPRGTADKIALFYESVLDATTSVIGDNTKVAMIAFGNVRQSGKADQSILFRETDETLPEYDGHHIAMYIGKSAADFEQAFANVETAGVVWANPRFSDRALDLEGARHWKQFRFKDIVDMETGEKIFELEHEMRSIQHEAWPGAGR